MADCQKNGEAAKAAEWSRRVRDILAAGSSAEFEPKGYSMWPALRPGSDTVRLSPAQVYRRGDIVLALCDGGAGVVLHRIAAVGDGRATLMGDSNLYRTEMCRTADIIGRVSAVFRRGRDVSASPAMRLQALIQRLPPMLRRTAVRILNLRMNAIRRKQ